MIVIAQLGGYLNRKGDGPPGFECLWKGYVLFDAKVQIISCTSRCLMGSGGFILTRVSDLETNVPSFLMGQAQG